jgi:CheY-like chemotaxis protein
LTIAHDPGRYRLLYIDDDVALGRLIQRRLERRGFIVECATSGAEGIAKAEALPFDVIAIDHYMPGQDGLEAMESLLALPAPPPVVYVTGSDESRIAVAALKAGAADYVVKTASDDFIDLLASALAQAVAQVKLVRERDAATEALLATNERLEAIVARQAVLLREVNHRVANSLQLVSSLVHMQGNAVTDEASRSALRDTQARIGAIMQVHKRLYTSEDVEQVDIAEYLRGLVDELGQSLSAGGCRPILLEADSIKMSTDKAVALGVVVAELLQVRLCRGRVRRGAGPLSRQRRGRGRALRRGRRGRPAGRRPQGQGHRPRPDGHRRHGPQPRLGRRVRSRPYQGRPRHHAPDGVKRAERPPRKRRSPRF